MVAVATAPYADLVDLQTIRTEKAERHFREFVKQGWHVVEPDRELVPGFYVDAICDHVQAVFEGDIKRLVITLPPGFLKSTIVSVLFPAWMWIARPSFRFLTTSHEADLAMRDAVRSRRVMMSEWYQDRWGGLFSMTTDQNVKTRYENDHTGHRISLGTGSGITGKRGDLILCDDPHDAEDAHSTVQLEGTVRWWNETVPSRLNDPKNGAKIVIQQRIHVNDLAGVVIDQGYEHLNLPMEYDPDHRGTVTSIGWSDPRTQPGELLDPVRYGPPEIAEKRMELGTRGYEAQYQQRPASAEGGILKRPWFETYTNRPYDATIIQSWDTAFKDGKANDYSVCVTIAYTATGRYLLDIYRERLEYPDLERMVPRLYGQWRPSAVLIEDKASGQSLIQSTRRNTDIPVIAVPVTKDKIKRVNEQSPQIEAGRVYLPEAAPWLEDALHELTSFPLAAHDDIVDAVMQGLAYIASRTDEERSWGGSWLPDDDDDDRRSW
jgi:predicted phage terminase large subunit-like protein